MQYTDRPSLTQRLVLLPMLVAAHILSACADSNNSTASQNQQAQATPEDKHPLATATGTIAVSSEALFDFLYAAASFEFWSCAYSDSSENSYIVLDSKDNEADEGFNPLLLLGLLRRPQLTGDPRARNEKDLNNGVELLTIPVTFGVTSADSISFTLHAGRRFASGDKETTVNFTTVRTGPGRAFTADDLRNNTQITCTANNVGADIMF